MDYEKKYKEALEWMRSLYDGLHGATKEDAEHYFPELKESEDERIRKELIKHINANCEADYVLFKKFSSDDVIAWLEKQGEKKSTDNYKPKFKIGDWITDGHLTCKVLSVTGKSYELHLYNDDYCHFETDVKSIDKYYHLWTIKDAKDGDVLVCKGNTKDSNGIKYERICLFNSLGNDFFTLTKTSNCVEEYDIDVNIDYPDNTVPATKEQKEILFMAMKEAGYEWDADKKELKKIEIKTLDADKVIAWLVANILDYEYYVKWFKKDFKL